MKTDVKNTHKSNMLDTNIEYPMAPPLLVRQTHQQCSTCENNVSQYFHQHCWRCAALDAVQNREIMRYHLNNTFRRRPDALVNVNNEYTNNYIQMIYDNNDAHYINNPNIDNRYKEL